MKRRRAGLSGSPAGGGIAVPHGTCPRTHRGIGCADAECAAHPPWLAAVPASWNAGQQQSWL